MFPTEDNWREARMHAEARRIAGALESVAANGSPQQAMEAMRLEWKNIWEANGGCRDAARREWRQVLKMANAEAYDDELSLGLPFVLIHGARNEQGHLRHDIVRQVGGHWENWNPHAQSWSK